MDTEGLLEEIQEESYDAVLIFVNPFDSEEKGTTSTLTEELTIDMAVNLYHRVFQLHDIDNRDFDEIKKIDNDLKKFKREKELSTQIQLKDLVSLIFTNICYLLQHHCKFDISVTLSRDKDRIFVRIRASEENLKVAADLDNFQLQFKAGRNHTEDFKKIPPYAPFELENKSASGHSDPENYYQKYDEYDTPIEEGGSLFHNQNRIKLIYRIIILNIDLSVLTPKGIVQFMPMHQNYALDPLKSSLGSTTNFTLKQDIPAIRMYFGERIALYYA